MNDQYLQDVGYFHAKFGIDALEPGIPLIPENELMLFRLNFMLEELSEIAEANGYTLTVEKGEVKFVADIDAKSQPIEQRLVKTLDGLVDLQYVLMGTVRLCGFHTESPHGIRFHEAWRRVQAANVRKVRANSKKDSKRGSLFDVVKPEGWVGPDLWNLV